MFADVQQFTVLIGPPGSIVPYFGADTGMPATAGWGLSPCSLKHALCQA